MQKYQGQCHCGQVQYEFESVIDKVFVCNCSHCAIKGMQLTFIPESKFTLVSGKENLVEYRFNKKTIEHLFCKVCGVQTFSFGSGPNGEKMACINLRTVKDLDVTGLPEESFNGKDL